MSELYWLSVLGNAQGVFIFLMIISVIGMFFSLLMYDSEYNKDGKIAQSYKKVFKVSVITLCVTAILLIFTPSKKDMYLIMGVGTILDYTQENKAVQELPDKCVKALNKWVKSLEEE